MDLRRCPILRKSFKPVNGKRRLKCLDGRFLVLCLAAMNSILIGASKSVLGPCPVLRKDFGAINCKRRLEGYYCQLDILCTTAIPAVLIGVAKFGLSLSPIPR